MSFLSKLFAALDWVFSRARELPATLIAFIGSFGTAIGTIIGFFSSHSSTLLSHLDAVGGYADSVESVFDSNAVFDWLCWTFALDVFFDFFSSFFGIVFGFIVLTIMTLVSFLAVVAISQISYRVVSFTVHLCLPVSTLPEKL